MGDRERLAKVFVPLVAYHRWMREHRTWLNGTYFTCGLGSGMDNQVCHPVKPYHYHSLYATTLQPRPLPPYNPYTQHGHMSWIDACCQVRSILEWRLL